MDKELRNKLRNVVTQCRKLLEESVSQLLQGRYGIHPDGRVEDESRLAHLSAEEQTYRDQAAVHLLHIVASRQPPKQAVEQLVREVAFTHLNRLAAFKLMESRKLIREAVSRGPKSNGYKFYLADHQEDYALDTSGQQEIAYRHFLHWQAQQFSGEISALFSRNDLANRLFPPQRVLDQVLELVNGDDIAAVWARGNGEDEIGDETIGWIYQYFTPKELRDQARRESAAPRNSYELAFRNQFYTPRYVVRFLVDNTLGRIWYEMRRGETALSDKCKYLVHRKNEVFLDEGQQAPPLQNTDGFSQEQLLALPVHIAHRPKKDPRELRILDPAVGSAHFLLYCFDLLQLIYEEAYADADLGPALRKDYPTLDALKKAVPALILQHNLHGIDIDLRATQIAGLALWLRAQRAFQDLGIRGADRPAITRANIVCAEPMPGEADLLEEFTATLQPRVLGQLVKVIFDKMKLAGEAGSLLKVEQEISGAIAEAKRQWLAVPKDEQLTLWPGERRPRTEQGVLFDVRSVTDEAFWSDAEAKVLDALRQYASNASNGRGLPLRLFAEDAERGFGFIELCRLRYDVVLMNPPFGEAALPAKGYVDRNYRTCKDDLCACFVTRGLELLRAGGRLGAITNRTPFFLTGQEQWRRSLTDDAILDVFVDLGDKVLDSALVETAAYVFERSATRRPSSFIRLVRYEDKASQLLAITNALLDTSAAQGERLEVYIIHTSAFEEMPGRRFSYWVPSGVRSLFGKCRRFSPDIGSVEQGISTKDDFRFVRAIWEIASDNLGQSQSDTLDRNGSRGKQWLPLAKGGEYSPYYGDIHLVVFWHNNGKAIEEYVLARYPYLNGNSGWVLHPESQYCQPGLTYSKRTTSGFSPRLLLAGCMFNDTGCSIFPRAPEMILPVAGVLMSRVVSYLLELSVASADAVSSGSAARHYEIGTIGDLPFPTLRQEDTERISTRVRAIWERRRDLERSIETSHAFLHPVAVPLAGAKSIRDSVLYDLAAEEDRLLQILDNSFSIETIVRRAYGVDAAAQDAIDEECGSHVCRYTEDSQVEEERFAANYLASLSAVIEDELEESGASRGLTKKTFFAERSLEIAAASFRAHPNRLVQLRRKLNLVRPERVRDAAACLLSYAIGCLYGRWDIRCATGLVQSRPLPVPEERLPLFAPGALGGAASDGTTIDPARYPVRIDRDAILVDDADNSDDHVRRVRDILSVMWKDQSGEIEQEACDLLDVADLREYFRRSGAGGFWLDHLRRYSKSRRKAPIYWLLQSAGRRYAIWLYYHHLDKDILFKALLNYVEPKVRLEEDRLKTVQSQKALAGTTGRAARQLEKDVDKQLAFVSELHDFRDKLKRAADLNLVPDLNDGVVLNIAPLHELVPWREAKDYWDELKAGKYEWSSIGKQLREKGLVR